VDTWQKGYSITNAGLGIRPEKGPWDLSLWAKNLFDTHYFTGLAPVSQYQPVLGIPGDPLQVGLTFRYKL
jgi:iron complex outermembrane receptor protein